MAARLWNKAPFVRLLFALALGVLWQWYLPLPSTIWLSFFGLCFLAVGAFSFTSMRFRYRFSTPAGLALFLLLLSTGALLVWKQDVRNAPAWFGQHYQPGDFVALTIQEPLVEKTASFKAVASVTALYRQQKHLAVSGEVILYFKKDSLPPPLNYGHQLLLSAHLQVIKNAGNPGSFDYKTFSLFKGITHQANIRNGDYVVLPEQKVNWFKQSLFTTRAWVLDALRTFIPGEKEQALAEALLIGYRDDLDRNLVQAYSNTGVVHVIAISGLHLGIIYWLLLRLTWPLKRTAKLRWLRVFFIISGLWLFSLLAGAGPSVLRSALMFSLVALGEVSARKTNIFNTLSFSAFVLLLLNPFLLWDVGFQLSYAAVLSIVLFFRPIHNLLHLPNKAANFVWTIAAVTTAAQLLTLPISIYHFHQMPLLFLLANVVAVPVSTVVLIGLIFLCGLSFWPAAAGVIGISVATVIRFMNGYIEGLDRLPFATWNYLSITVAQTALLIVFAAAFCFWLMENQRRFAYLAFTSLALFMALRGASFFEAHRQQKLIVYNVPRRTAIDFISGRNYAFLGDSLLLHDGFERNFHLQPSRILHRISPQNEILGQKDFLLSGKQFLLLDEALPFSLASPKQKVDVLVLSKNPKIYLSKLVQSFELKQVVIDGSVPPWKAALWRRDCDSLKIPCYDVAEKGAFIVNL
jgi:competence protein ComEC